MTGDPSPALDLADVRRLVVLAAHPPDATVGAGGLMATATRRSLEVTVVRVTDDERGHPDLLATRLVELLGDGRDAVLVSPWRGDGHHDHADAGRAAAAAARRTGADLWEYLLPARRRPDLAEVTWPVLRSFVLDEEARAAKSEAVLDHVGDVALGCTFEGGEVFSAPVLLEHVVAPVEVFLTTASHACPDETLDDLHREVDDPWGVDSRFYESRKRDLVLAALPRPRFERVLEIGCSTGALAEALHTRSERVWAVDRSAAALAAARARFSGLETVTVVDLDVPHQWLSDMTFDLVVISEVGYFLSPVDLEVLVDRVAGTLAPGGVVVLCHWRHPVAGWVLDADRVHGAFVDPRLPALGATYRDRDVEIRVHAAPDGWPDPLA